MGRPCPLPPALAGCGPGGVRLTDGSTPGFSHGELLGSLAGRFVDGPAALTNQDDGWMRTAETIGDAGGGESVMTLVSIGHDVDLTPGTRVALDDRTLGAEGLRVSACAIGNADSGWAYDAAAQRVVLETFACERCAQPDDAVDAVVDAEFVGPGDDGEPTVITTRFRAARR